MTLPRDSHASNLVDVTEAQFFAVIRKQNVTPHPRGKYPYVSEWTTPSGQLLGRSTEDTYQLAAYLAQEAA